MAESARRSVPLLRATGWAWALTPCLAFAQCELGKTTASDAADDDLFGRAIAASGQYVVVGAPLDDDGGDAAGAAYVFIREGAQWTQQAKLTADDAAANDEFGSSVAISGDYAVVGSPLHDQGGSNAGAAYVFRRQGTAWLQEAKLTAGDAAGGDLLGTQVSISGDYVVVGAPGHDVAALALRMPAATDAGAAYVFQRQGADWTQAVKLTSSDATANERLGTSVSISGDVVVAGAPGDDHGGAGGSGAARVFRRAGTSWSEEATLWPRTPSEAMGFGSAVAISGDYVAIGAFVTGGDIVVTVYVFERLALFWNQRARHEITRPDPAGTSLAVTVAIEGETVIAGAPFAKVGGNDSGLIAVLDRGPFTWHLEASLSATDIAHGDEFGRSVAISDGYGLVGAPGDDDGGTDSGSAYLLWAASRPDCNNNDVADFCDIWTGASADADSNGVPDACEACSAQDDWCDDGRFCNGSEACNLNTSRCQSGAPPCADELFCDELHDECDDCIDNDDCDDGEFCNGSETCSESGLCQEGTSPCQQGLLCDEGNGLCVECLTDGDCDDGQYCSGAETCDASGFCQTGTPPCTPAGLCDETAGACRQCQLDSDCDDAVFCNGPETCDQAGACQVATNPCQADQPCDEDNDECDDCSADADCDDGVACSGAETCDATGACQTGESSCSAGLICDLTADLCVECLTDGDCGDDEPCTIDACNDQAVCVHTPLAICPDADDDGVVDDRDRCPGTPQGAAVDADGCACNQSDDDGDEVNNCDDLCADTPRGQYVDESGCPVEIPPGEPPPADAGDGDGPDGVAGEDGSAGSSNGDDAAAPADGPPLEDQAAQEATTTVDEEEGAARGTGRRAGGGGSVCGLLGMNSVIFPAAGLALLRGSRRRPRRMDAPDR